MAQTEKEIQRSYRRSKKGKATRRRYWRSKAGKAKHKERAKRYWQTEKGKTAMRRWRRSKLGKATMRRWRRSDRGKAVCRRAILRFRYGLTVGAYQQLRREQQGRCPICERRLPTKLRACVDHDHKTGRVRGLLHKKCNAALGMLEDNLRYARNAVRYLS